MLSATPARGLHHIQKGVTTMADNALSHTRTRIASRRRSCAGRFPSSSQPHLHADCIEFVGEYDLSPTMLSATPARGLHREEAQGHRQVAGSQPHPHADCIGTMQQRWLCIRTLCIQFKPYRVYPAEQKRSNAVLISILGCRVTLCHVHYDAYSMFNWGSHWYIRG